MVFDDPMDTYQTLSIATSGFPTLARPERRIFEKRGLNDISDIEGAQSCSRYQFGTNKPQFLNSDVEGAVPKQLARSRNTRDNSLYIDDIEGTRHTIKDRMMRTERHVNPLDPQYSLPSYVPVQSVEAKYLKDPLRLDDIEGTRSRAKKEFSTRNILNTDDIEGSRPGLKSRKFLAAMKPRELLDNDVSMTTNSMKDRSQRVTDPCNPVYRINGMDIYDDKYTKPKPPKRFIEDNFLLKTRDITGAVTDSRSSTFVRTECKNTNFLGDIEGAQADSIKHSITTKRYTNPLQPVYQALDPGELLLPLIPPLIPVELIKVPTLPQVSRDPHKVMKGNTASLETLGLTGYSRPIRENHTPPENKFKVLDHNSTHSKGEDNLSISNSRFTPSQKKVLSERMAEINLVRGLQ